MEQEKLHVVTHIASKIDSTNAEINFSTFNLQEFAFSV
jgi:hypothetical protein